LKKYDIILFDADRTLFDFDKAEKKAIKKICNDINIIFNKKNFNNYKRINHKYWEDFEKGLIKQDIINNGRFKDFFEYLKIDEDYIYYANKYLDYLSEGTYLIKGAHKLVKRLSKNYILILLTNGLTQVQQPRFNNSKIKKYFDNIVISQKVKCKKPEKEIFDIALNKYQNIKRKRMIIIGDSLTSDIKGGINAKIDTCWYNIDRVINKKEIKPDYTIEDLKEVLVILGEQNG